MQDRPASAIVVPTKGGTFDIRNFGAHGDGVSDDTAAIQKAIDTVSRAGGGVLRFPAATYLINTIASSHAGITVRSDVTLDFEAGATLKAIPNGSRNYAIISISGAKNVKILGGLLLGDRSEHRGTDGEWGHCLVTGNGARGITVVRTVAKECWGDGFYIGESTRVVLDKVVADHNRRQGLSITSGSDIVVRGSTFRNTEGTKPESGIDIEPNQGDTVDHLIIEGCRILHNAGSGISDGVPTDYEGSAHIRNVEIVGNLVSYNGVHSLRSPPMSGIELTLVSGHRITRNVITNNFGFGISLHYRADSNFLSGNIIKGNSLGRVH